MCARDTSTSFQLSVGIHWTTQTHPIDSSDLNVGNGHIDIPAIPSLPWGHGLFIGLKLVRFIIKFGWKWGGHYWNQDEPLKFLIHDVLEDQITLGGFWQKCHLYISFFQPNEPHSNHSNRRNPPFLQLRWNTWTRSGTFFLAHQESQPRYATLKDAFRWLAFSGLPFGMKLWR